MGFIIPALVLSGALNTTLISPTTNPNDDIFRVSAWEVYNNYINPYEDVIDRFSQITLRINGYISTDNRTSYKDLRISATYDEIQYNSFTSYDNFEDHEWYEVASTRLDYSSFPVGFNEDLEMYYQSFSCEITFTNLYEYIMEVADSSEVMFYIAFGFNSFTYDTDIRSVEIISYDNNSTSEYYSGYGDGYDDGYDVGYNDGVNLDSNLLDLIVAVPDRFINSFRIIFNFEIFGINIFSFMVSIISLGVVIFIIKKVAS